MIMCTPSLVSVIIVLLPRVYLFLPFYEYELVERQIAMNDPGRMSCLSQLLILFLDNELRDFIFLSD